ncbi:hypothetical protein ACSRUE_00980 [Sorangium sp. KYC3313]|uniref:hypothetical protein n=1 Tax=Sorangium sp. KYC3313 TaxID=3449740 RepID=UPI003F8CD26E
MTFSSSHVRASAFSAGDFEEYDRGDKFEHYKSFASLRQYVLVSHRERSVEVSTRDVDGGFTSAMSRESDVALLASIGARLDVRELYEAAAEPGV